MLSRKRQVPIFGLITLSLLSFGSRAWSQEEAGALPALIIAEVERAIPLDGLASNSLVVSRKYTPLDQAQTAPNYLVLNKNFNEYLSSFDRLPSQDGSTKEQPGVKAQLSQLVGDIQFGTRKLTGPQSDELEQARTLLFEGGDDKPSKAYEKYLDYERQYNDEVEKLSAEIDPAKRASMQTRIAQIERDWRLFGMRDEIAAALNVVADLSPANVKDLYEDWTKTLSGYDPEYLLPLDQSLTSSEWLKVSVSSGSIRDFKVVMDVGGKRVQLPRLRRLSFDVGVVNLPRPPVSHPLFLDSTWRTKSGRVLSDGNPDADDAGELLPRVNSALVVVKNLELHFSEPIEPSHLAQLAQSKDSRLSSINVKGVAGLSYQQKLISLSSLVVVGLIVDNLTKLPNPDLDLDWLQRG